METNQAVFAEKQQCRKAKESESERCKKGEWSDGAIYSLLDAYEMKWNKRNRGNLRVGDWEEVSVLVSSRCEGSKPAKTSTQCKNKIEGMKKRYRLEALDSCNVNRNGCSSWPFFSRMDGLLRSPNRMMMAGIPGGLDSGGLGLGLGFSELVENGHSDQAPLRADDDGTAMLCPDDGHIQRHVPFSHLQLLQGDGDLRGRAFFPEEEEEEDDEEGEDMQEAESKHEGISQTLLQRKENSETSAHGCKPAATPLTAAAVAAADAPMATRKPCAKQKKHVHNEVAASIRTFAESILKLEHAKMEMYKDAERLRAEAEARRADLELRRTEMIMNTQLEIAKLLSCNSINDSKKKMTKKKKKKKKASKAPFKNGVPSTDAGLLQTVSQQTQHVEAIPFSQSVSGNEY